MRKSTHIKTARKSISLTFLSLILFSGAANAYTVRQCGLWLNGVPGIVDSANSRLFFTLPKLTPSTLNDTLTWDTAVYSSVKHNGTTLSQGGANLHIADWHTAGTDSLTVVTTSGSTATWALVFTNLPIISVEADQGTLFEANKLWQQQHNTSENLKLLSSITVIDANRRTFVNPEIETDAPQMLTTFSSDVMIGVRGATSKGLPKKSFGIEIVDTQGKEYNVHLLGYRSDGDWILDAMCYDQARMRNRVNTDIWNSIQDLPYPKDNNYQRNGTDGEYVELFMQGHWWGLYCFTDKIDRKKLNLKKTKAATATTPEVIRGMLWKGLLSGPSTTLFSYEDDPQPDTLVWETDYRNRAIWEQKYPDDRQDQADFRPLAHLISITGMSGDQVLQDSLENYVYISQVIDYLILSQALQWQDNLQKNIYASVVNILNTPRILFTPWDIDCSMGRDVASKDITDNAQWHAFGEKLGGINNLIFKMSLDQYLTKWHCQISQRWDILRAGPLSIDSVTERLNVYADLFTQSGAWSRELEKWENILVDGSERHIAHNIHDEITFITNFLQLNYAKFDSHVEAWGCPPAGINDIASQKLNIKLHPNPVETGCTISGLLEGEHHYLLYSADGRVAQEGTISNLQVMNISALAPGVYFLRICASTMKLIKL